MSNYGFTITEIFATGPGIVPAFVELKPGLNVISGASDTGKTYLFQALNYLLGGSRPPKAVPEAAPYTTLGLSLKDRAGNEYTLERPAKGGGANLYTGSGANINRENVKCLLAQSTVGRDDTISAFYLKLTGLYGKKVRKNARGETRELSFRDLAHLNTIDEVKIYTEESPILSGQYTQKTVEQSVIKLLLTGDDDSDLTALPSRPIQRAGREASLNLVSELIGQCEAELRQISNDHITLILSENHVRSRLEQITQEVKLRRDTLSEAQQKREEAHRRVISTESRKMLLSEVISRFDLLKVRYQSDIERHSAVAEAGDIFELLPLRECPFCHADAQHQRHEDHQEVQNLGAASRKEAKKLRVLLNDLESTTIGVRDDLTSLTLEGSLAHNALNELDAHVEETLKPLVQSSQDEWIELTNQLTKIERAHWLSDHIKALSDRREKIGEVTPVSQLSLPPGVDDALQVLCAEIEHTLKSWRFPFSGRVVFDPAAQDFAVTFRLRNTFGKGIRALIYSAFCISLLRFCNEHSLPHPGFVAIDSPLVAYREPDTSEEENIGTEVKMLFFENLSSDEPDEQVIIFENEDPPAPAALNINHVHFSGTPGAGRHGFFPIATS